MNQGCTLRDPPEKACLFGAKFFAACFALALTTATCKAQAASGQQPSPPATKANPELQVNWLYGAYVPKDVPLHPLSNQQRFQLFLRQSFTTPGVYVKTALFSLSDRARDDPPEWGDGFGGYAKRTASRYGQFVTQNAYRIRETRCWATSPVTTAAAATASGRAPDMPFSGTSMTYNRTESQLRPQFASYAGAFGAGVIASTWQPRSPNLLTNGYQGVITQAAFGICANWLGEFAPDIKRVLKKENKTGNSVGGNKSAP